MQTAGAICGKRFAAYFLVWLDNDPGIASNRQADNPVLGKAFELNSSGMLSFINALVQAE